MSSRILSTALRASSKRLASVARVSVRPALLSVRFNSTSATKQLKEVLKSELKISNTIPNELDPLYSEYLQTSGFEVVDTEGLSNVQLKKTLDNGEVIRVFFDIDEVTDVPLNDTPIEEEGQAESFDDELDSLDSLLCNVRVLIENPADNKGLFLNLFLQGSENSFLIDYINYKDDVASFLQNEVAKGEFLDKFRYQGPRFSDLDESVQTGFESYLDSKGINDNLAEFILSFSEFKEEKEYRKWLTDLASYLK